MNRSLNFSFAIFSCPKYLFGKVGTNLKFGNVPIINRFCSTSEGTFSIQTTVVSAFWRRDSVKRRHSWLQIGNEVFGLNRRCVSSVPTELLNIGDGRQVAYKLTVGDHKKPTVVYVPGMLNTMDETKAVWLNKFCESSQLTFIRFDFEGIGESPGNIEKVSFGQWIEDLRHVVNQLCKTPVIFVAFSMGGWISSKVAIEIPESLHSILYVAPGFNFLQYYFGIFYEKLPPEQKKDLDDGKIVYFKDLFLRKDFAVESVKHHINMKEKIPIKVPIRILHGMLDRDAPYKVSLDLLPQFESTDVDLFLRKSGKHHMLEPSDLAWMTSLLGELVQKYPLNK